MLRIAGALGLATGAAAAAGAGGAQVVFLSGDRVPQGQGTASVERLQQPGNVKRILSAKFPGSAIVVVEPPRYDRDFARYDGWLPPGPLREGVPHRFAAAGFPAATQLAGLLGAAEEGAVQQPGQPSRALVLLGFSKAGVVLHQVLVELAAWQQAAGQGCAVCAWHARQQQQRQREGATSPSSPATAAASSLAPAPLPPGPEAALAAIRELHWLDAGANSLGAAYTSSPPLFEELARRCAAHAVRLHLHGTARQWHDPARRWLEREAAGMVAVAAAAGVPCASREYEVGPPGSLEQHFGIIEVFETS